jgi:hypothetical protein
MFEHVGRKIDIEKEKKNIFTISVKTFLGFVFSKTQFHKVSHSPLVTNYDILGWQQLAL